jgi:hypothetical protein
MKLNLTQHNATPEQIEAGVVDLAQLGEGTEEVHRLLTFTGIPSPDEMTIRARRIAGVARDLWATEGPGREIYLALATSGLGEGPWTEKVACQRSHATAMIGGAPFFTRALEDALNAAGITPVYAFSSRESVEEVLSDGSVRKVTVFKHRGFVHLNCGQVNLATTKSYQI